ncbi:MAG: PEP/pyruvate-binding domain-containing protein [Polyangiales bacterium]
MAFVETLASARDSARFGSKAAALSVLCAAPHVRVPSGFVVDAAVFRAFIEAALPAAQWPERLLSAPESERVEDKLAAIRAVLAAAKLPERAWLEVLEAYRALGARVVAVRSSALQEDTRLATAAGVFATDLGVIDEAGLERAIRSVYCRLYDVRALAYLARIAPREPPALALIVQRVVPASAAGVLFTEDPVRREPGVMRVEATLGLGASVVDGAVAPDVFTLALSDGSVVRSEIAAKDHALVVGPRGGVERVRFDPPRAEPSLDREQLDELASTARSVQRTLGGPRDIEFAFEDRTLWVLQARPIVTLLDPSDERAQWVWSNVNVGEALPGVATPLTWSIAAAFSELGFRRAFAALGCVVPEGAELVGRFDGRIYLNLTHFLRIASQVPALDPKMLLEFGGGSGLDEVAAQLERGSWARFALRVPSVLATWLKENVALDERVARYEREADAFRNDISAADRAAMTRAELALELERIEAHLDRTGTLMLTCASGALSSVVLVRALLRFTARNDAERLERALLTGNADLESAQPGIALAHIAARLATDAAARSLVESRSAADLRVESLPDGATRRSLESFLRAYGHRAVREAELYTPRWSEEPSMLFSTLAAQLAHGVSAALDRVDQQSRARDRAEHEWMDALPAAIRSIARHALSRARKFLRLRERMRGHVTEVLGYFRVNALEVSRRLARHDPACAADAAFFLEVDEVREFLRGAPLDVAALSNARRAHYLRDVARPDPPNSFVGAPPPLTHSLATHDAVLRGIAASGGAVRGRARIVRDPAHGSALQPGEILVVRVADVGWTPLFLTAAGVVTELGGALSHASLVAREYGVPAVVNVERATSILRDGQLVEVDGDGGVVRVLEERGP